MACRAIGDLQDGDLLKSYKPFGTTFYRVEISDGEVVDAVVAVGEGTRKE